ncbi:MAG TPA: hypothetical protein VFA71_14210 [Terriglobales bacterium]|nr:hypothetical protein [Terriglobales bacterium]
MSHATKSQIGRRGVLIILSLLATASLCRAQAGSPAEAPKNRLPLVELAFTIPTIKATENSHVGMGARAVFNPHALLSVELEVNHIVTDSGENRRNHPNGAGIDEVFAGVKSGHRFRHVGLFAKARPGYLGFSQFVLRQPLVEPNDPGSALNRRERFVKRPAFDLGMVFEFYLSKHWAFRTDVGDTMAFFNSRFAQDVDLEGVTRHNLQSGFAIQFRF